MSTPFVAREMTRTDAQRAYALVEAIRPNITLDNWLNHIKPLIERESTTGRDAGAIVLSAGGDYLYGAFTYRLWTTLALGRTLMVDDFCAVGLAGERTPAHALFAAADEVAQQHECEAVCVKFLDGDRAEQNWHSYADGAAYVPIPAVAKRID